MITEIRLKVNEIILELLSLDSVKNISKPVYYQSGVLITVMDANAVTETLDIPYLQLFKVKDHSLQMLIFNLAKDHKLI